MVPENKGVRAGNIRDYRSSGKLQSSEMDSEVSSGRDIRSWFGGRLVISAALFLIIPILFVIAVAQLTKADGPQWMPDSFENPYNYLFNSLIICKNGPGNQPADDDEIVKRPDS
jgi:hypothetical protein